MDFNELSSKFFPHFYHPNAQVCFGDFNNIGGEIKHFDCNCENIGDTIIKTFLNWYQENYGDDWESNNLSEIQKQHIFDKFNNTTQFNGAYQNKCGIIAENLLKIYRSCAGSNGFSPQKKLSGTTQAGEDFYEILVEGSDYILIQWDAVNDIGYTPKTKIIRKIKELHKKKWAQEPSLIENLEDNDKLTDAVKGHLRMQIGSIPTKKVIFVVSEQDLDTTNMGEMTFLQFLINNARSNATYRTILEEIEREGKYIPYYVFVKINNYGNILKEEIIGVHTDENRKFTTNLL